MALICAASLLFSGCSNNQTQENNSQSRDETVDFVVVGGGAGGLSAASEAARQGKSVILLEKLANTGGSSALSEGYFWSADSKLNEQHGEGVSASELEAHLLEAADGKAVDGAIHNITTIAADVMNTMLDEGVTFQSELNPSTGGFIQDPRMQIFVAEGAGAGLMQGMLKAAQDLNVDIRCESKAVDLIVENNEVKGVKVEDKEGEYNIYAENTILATGGFLRNEALMKEYTPNWYDPDPYCGAGSTGDGHEMAMKLGAHMIGDNFGSVWNFDGKNGYHMEGGLLPMLSFFRVNQEGKRVMNEYGSFNVNANNDITVQQTGKRVYCFMDSTSNYASMAEQSVEKGLAYKADTLEELAELYGIDTEEFMNTVNQYNQVKASGEDDPEFGVPNAYMVSMSEAPFYATYYQPWATNCLLGLECNENFQLLDENNQPIPHLYGVGELVIGSIVGDGNYPSCGTCLASGIYGGPIAVRHALGLMK